MATLLTFAYPCISILGVKIPEKEKENVSKVAIFAADIFQQELICADFPCVVCVKRVNYTLR